jgi:hypothetical protein
LVLAVTLLYGVGCVRGAINAGFPEVPVQSAERSVSRPKVGIARVEDSRPKRAAGSIGATTLLVGPELLDYIERRFRNELAERGFDAVEVLNPTKSASVRDLRTIAVTLQSASFGTADALLFSADASANIAVQVYAPASTQVIFARSFSGNSDGRIGLRGAGLASGGILAIAADRAIDAAFEDPQFIQSLR